MAWYDVFDEETDDWYDSDDDGWGITYDTSFEDPWYDEYGDSLDAAFDSGDESWYEDLGDPYTGPITNRWDTGFGGQANKYTGIGSALGGLFGGKDAAITGKDMMRFAGGLGSAYLQDRDNDRYNEMMQPLTDLYKAQAADVAKRRANRDANIASEYDATIGLFQPYWDRRDQQADNQRFKQGKYQSSSAAWDRAANEQTRDATRLSTQQQIANAYDERTAALGGQLRGLNPWNEKYGEAQENPYLNTGLRGLMGV